MQQGFTASTSEEAQGRWIDKALLTHDEILDEVTLWESVQKLKMLGKEVDERLLVEKFADFQLE